MNGLGHSHRRQIGDTEVHWAELGSGRRSVVLIHGLSDTHRTWRRVAPALADRGWRVLLPDLPGHGLSGRPDASYSVEWHADILRRWIHSLSLRRYDLVGHSFGGGVALQLLRDEGKRVRRLGLVASGGLGREVFFGLKLLNLPGVDHLVEAGLSVGTRIGHVLTNGGTNEDIDWHARVNATPGTGRALVRTVRSAVDLQGQRDNVYRHLGSFRRLPPVLLLWGDRDPVIPYEHAVRATESIPGAELVRFDGCGHFPHQEDADAFNRALIRHLQTRPRLLTRARGLVDALLARLGLKPRRSGGPRYSRLPSSPSL